MSDRWLSKKERFTTQFTDIRMRHQGFNGFKNSTSNIAETGVVNRVIGFISLNDYTIMRPDMN